MLALALQAAAESGFALRFELPLAVAALCAVPYALALMARRLELAGRFRAAGWVGRALHFSPPPLFFAAVGACGWLTTVARLTGGEPTLSGWPTPVLLPALGPFVAYSLAAIDARARLSSPLAQGAAVLRRFQLRQFASALAPFLLYATLAWIAGLSEDVRVRVEEVSAWGAVFALALLAVFVVALPWILAHAWGTQPLEPGPLRLLCTELAARARFRFRELLVWRTGNLLANAAVAGVVPSQRIVLFSDALLAVLTPREVASVFAHEVGHAVRHHVLAFLAWAAVFVLALDLSLGLVEEAWMEIAVFVVLGALWYLLFGWLSRRFELEADLFSLELTGDAEGLCTALEKVGSPHTRALSSWRHFSVARRVDFLRAAAASRMGSAGLRRTLRRWTAVGVLAALALGALEVRKLAREYPEQSVIAELRLGEYASARERAGRIRELPPELARLVARTAEVAEHEPADVQQLEESARASLRRGDGASAMEWLALASLRGAKDLEPVAAALEALADGASEAELEALGTSAPEWVEDVARFAGQRGAVNTR